MQILIIEDATKEIVSAMSVHSERQAERVENGASINLNHNEYSIIRNTGDREYKVGETYQEAN